MPKGKTPAASLLELLALESKKHEVTELHVHLGGSVPLYRLWEMGIARGIRGVAASYEDFIRVLHRTPETTGDLDRYLEIFDMVELIQAGPQAVAESIRIAINGAYRTGGMRQLGPGGEGGDPNPVLAIRRLELRFNPMKRTGVLFTKRGISGLYDVDRIIRAACESVEESELAYRGGIELGLIFCFGRDLSWEVNRVLAEKISHWHVSQRKLIGIDLAGPESAMALDSPADLERMAELFEMAGSDLGRTIHCGETRVISIETFLNTIRALKPHRIGHPIVAARAFWESGDARGLELLAERGIVCELCIQSNLLTRAIQDAAEYKRFLETLDKFGIPYTFSTDSPALQLSTLAGELEYLLTRQAITPEQIFGAFQAADRASFIHRRRDGDGKQLED
jgi:adenosine deaminase